MIRTVQVFAAAISIAGLIVSWQVFVAAADNLWIRGLARGIEANAFDDNSPPSQDGKWLAVVDTESCASDVLYPALVIVLRKLDRLNVSENYDEWAVAMAGGDRFLRHAADCLPASGDIWARIAMVDRAIAENPEKICNLTRLSRAFAPNEALVIAARMQLYNALSPSTSKRCDDIIRSDIRTILSFGRKANFSKVLANASPEVGNVIKAEFQSLAAPEKKWARREFPEFLKVDAVFP